VLAPNPLAFSDPRLTEAALDLAPDLTNWHPFVFLVERNKLGVMQNTEEQLRYPPPVVTNRGILATLLFSPDRTPVKTPYNSVTTGEANIDLTIDHTEGDEAQTKN